MSPMMTQNLQRAAGGGAGAALVGCWCWEQRVQRSSRGLPVLEAAGLAQLSWAAGAGSWAGSWAAGAGSGARRVAALLATQVGLLGMLCDPSADSAAKQLTTTCERSAGRTSVRIQGRV